MATQSIGPEGKDCKCKYSNTEARYLIEGNDSNPLLAETFEDVRMKFIAEKVCHNPVEIAYHAEGEKWDLSVTSCGKTKFWGPSSPVVMMAYPHLTHRR